MPEFCSCGAQLPPDALFCHKCGKPQREFGPAEPEARPEVPVPPPAAARPQPLPLNFRNPVALRIAILMAVGATLLSFLPYVNWLAAGYFAVFFYRRRTGYPLNLRAGVHMGWITGVMMFAIIALLLGGSVILINMAGGIEVLQSQFKNMSDPRVEQMLRVFRNGSEVANLLVQLFIFITCLSMAGGALGAKLMGQH